MVKQCKMHFGMHWYLFVGILGALLLTMIQTRGLLDAAIIPFGDGGSFYKYALKLYGLLHSGQWGEFLALLTAPTKNLFPSSILFLFLPAEFANSAGYGFVNSLGWHVFLSVGIYLFLRAIKAESLTLAVLLLTCANILAFDPAYYFYMDFPFMALIMVSLGMGAIAVVQPTSRNMIWAGVCAALPFLSKPTNAFTTFALLGLFMAASMITRTVFMKQTHWRSFVARSTVLWSLGFIPVFALAAYMGAFESILYQIAAYTLDSGWVTHMSETGLKRWLYFPLCLSFFYSVPLLIAFILVLLICRYTFRGRLRNWVLALKPSGSDRLINALVYWSIVFFVVIYGVYFSFFLQTKVIRSLPFMLPILWIALLVATPLRKIRPWICTLLAAIFFSLIWLQAETGIIDGKQNRSAVYYEIKGDWYNRWPAKRPDLTQGATVTHHLYSLLRQAGVDGGKVVVGSQMMFWGPGDLATVCNQNAIRQGEPEPYTFTNFGSAENYPPSRRQIEDADALLLILEPRVQYSQLIYQQNVKLANHALGVWKGKVANVLLTHNSNGQPSVCVVAFREPVSWELLQIAEQQGAVRIRNEVEEKRADRFSEASVWGKVRLLLRKDENRDTLND